MPGFRGGPGTLLRRDPAGRGQAGADRVFENALIPPTKGNTMVTDVAELMKMTEQQLDDLFRSSPAGDIPNGEAQGTAIIAPGTDLEGVAAKFIHIFAWQGKVFDAAAGELRNRILPIGLHAIIAKVYKGTSWFDGKECIVLDYSQTSIVAH